MLKIKDNVDLKELEKFGFEFNYAGNSWLKKEIEFDGSMYPNTFELHIWEDDRTIKIYIENQPEFLSGETANVDIDGWSNGREFDLIYDLIKADLVEKVE
jgi:hypothetical protein